MTAPDLLDVTFALVSLPEAGTLGDMEYLHAKSEACRKIVAALEKINIFLSAHKECSVKYVTSDSIVVSGPRDKLQRFLNNKTAVETV